MKRCLIAVLFGTATVAAISAIASAYYNPALGRFMERDPIGYQDGMNLYQYARSNPLINLDPSGQKVVWLLVKAEASSDEKVPDLEDVTARSSSLQMYKRNVRKKILDKLAKIDDKTFSQVRDAGRVFLNGTPWKEGDLGAFRNIVERELESEIWQLNRGGYEAAIEKWKELAAKATKPYDQAVLDGHGGIGMEEREDGWHKIPSGVFNGEYVPNDQIDKDLADAMPEGGGTVLRSACFQHGLEINAIRYVGEIVTKPGSVNVLGTGKEDCSINFWTLRAELVTKK